MGEAWDKAVENLAEALFEEFGGYGGYGGNFRWANVVDAQKHRYRLMARAAIGYLAPAALEGRPVPQPVQVDDQAVKLATLKSALEGAESIAGDLLGGYHDDHDLEVFRHGMATICNFLRAKVGAAEGQVVDAGVTALLDHARKLWDAPDLSAYQDEGQWWVNLPGMTFPTGRVGAGSEAAALKRAIDAHPNPLQYAVDQVQENRPTEDAPRVKVVSTRPVIAAIQPGDDAPPLGCDCYGGCWEKHSEDWSRLAFATEDDAKFAWRRCHQAEELGVALPPDQVYPHGSYVLVDCELRFHSRELMWRHVRRLEVAEDGTTGEVTEHGHRFHPVTGHCQNKDCWANEVTEDALKPCPVLGEF